MFRRRFHRRGAFRRSGKQFPLRWTAETNNMTVLHGALTRQDLVLPSDYEFSTTLEPSGAVLKRVRMHYVLFFPAASTTLGATCTVGVVCEDNDDPAPVFGGFDDPRAAAQLIEQDWLYVRVHAVAHDATAASQYQAFSFEVDIKAQRKLKDQRVSVILSVDTDASSSVLMVWKARALLQIKPSG